MVNRPLTPLQSDLKGALRSDWQTASCLAFYVNCRRGSADLGPIGSARALNNLVRLGLAERRERRDGGLAWRLAADGVAA